MLKRYLPDYNDSTYPEKQFFYPLISTLFPTEVADLVKEARKRRSIEQETNEAVMVEVCEEMKKEIEDLLVHPSKVIYF